MSKYILIFVSVSLVAILAGCVMPTVEEAQQQVAETESAFCESIKVYQESLAALEDVSASTTVEELQELQQAAQDAFADMMETAGDLKTAEVQAVESAVAEFEEAVASVPADATLGEAAATIQESANVVQEALQQLDRVACVDAGTEGD